MGGLFCSQSMGCSHFAITSHCDSSFGIFIEDVFQKINFLLQANQSGWFIQMGGGGVLYTT